MKVDTYYVVYVRKDGRYEDEVISGPYYSLDKTIENVNILMACYNDTGYAANTGEYG